MTVNQYQVIPAIKALSPDEMQAYEESKQIIILKPNKYKKNATKQVKATLQCKPSDTKGLTDWMLNGTLLTRLITK